MLGPASPTHNYYYGSRDPRARSRRHDASRFLEAYNPGYYNEHYERYGLDVRPPAVRLRRRRSTRRTSSRVADRFERTIRETIDGDRHAHPPARPWRLRRRDHARERADQPLAGRELGLLADDRAELAYMGKQMRLLIDPRLVLFVELEGRPVGISLAVPDYNELFTAMGGRLGGWPAAFRFRQPAVHPLGLAARARLGDRRIDTARVIALGVLPTVWRGRKEVRREMIRLGPGADLRHVRQPAPGRLPAADRLVDPRGQHARCTRRSSWSG